MIKIKTVSATHGFQWRTVRNQSGFSLLEVIAVLILMAVLTTMAITALGNSNAEVVGQAEAIKAPSSVCTITGHEYRCTILGNGV